jgi:tripartite-type tricarboxylate transporter receptor subunit TctC
MRRTRWFGLTIAACMALATLTAQGADFPNRPIRVVVPFAAAGVTDIVARVVFERVSQTTGQNALVREWERNLNWQKCCRHRST